MQIEDLNAVIVIRNFAWRRLASTCFRGIKKKRAGNFCLWYNPHKMFSDCPYLASEIVDDAREAWSKESKTSSMPVECREIIGWSSTDNLSKYQQNGCLESFSLGNNARGLRIKKNRRDILAPKTSVITLIYELKREQNQFVIVIHSMYPGPDIGELVGDVSEREKVVFFDWNHPGEPL